MIVINGAKKTQSQARIIAAMLRAGSPGPSYEQFPHLIMDPVLFSAELVTGVVITGFGVEVFFSEEIFTSVPHDAQNFASFLISLPHSRQNMFIKFSKLNNQL
jgi:hypothetical protein